MTRDWNKGLPPCACRIVPQNEAVSAVVVLGHLAGRVDLDLAVHGFIVVPCVQVPTVIRVKCRMRQDGGPRFRFAVGADCIGLRAVGDGAEYVEVHGEVVSHDAKVSSLTLCFMPTPFGAAAPVESSSPWEGTQATLPPTAGRRDGSEPV